MSPFAETSMDANFAKRVARVSDNAVAKNQVPILTPTTRGMDNLVTADKPIGDKHNSPVLWQKYASTNHITATFPASIGICAPCIKATKPSTTNIDSCANYI